MQDGVVVKIDTSVDPNGESRSGSRVFPSQTGQTNDGSGVNNKLVVTDVIFTVAVIVDDKLTTITEDKASLVLKVHNTLKKKSQ